MAGAGAVVAAVMFGGGGVGVCFVVVCLGDGAVAAAHVFEQQNEKPRNTPIRAPAWWVKFWG